MRAAAVILETREHARRPRLELDLDRDVADQPWALGARGVQVDEANTREGLATQLIGMTEELVAATDAEDHRATVRGGVEPVALVLEIEGDQALIAVLATADVEEIGGVGVEAVAEAARVHSEGDSPPGAATLEHQ